MRSTDELEKEILTYRNVPVELAAEYIGCPAQGIRIGLQQNVLDIGTAIKHKKHYSYQISPYRLINYYGRYHEPTEEILYGLA